MSWRLKTTRISGGEGGQQLSISARGLTADEKGVAGLVEISNGSTRDKVGNNKEMLGIVDGRFNSFDRGINGMGSIHCQERDLHG